MSTTGASDLLYTAIRDKSLLAKAGHYFLFGCMALLLFPYLLPHTPFDTISPLRLFPAAIYGGISVRDAAAILLISILCWVSYIPLVSNSVFRSALLFAVLALLLIYGSSAVAAGGTGILNPLTLVIVSTAAGFIAARCCNDSSQSSSLLCMLLTLESAFALYGYTHHSLILISGNNARAAGTYDDPNALGLLMIAAVVCSTEKMRLSTDSVHKLVWTLCLSLNFSILILTWSRAAILGLFVSAVYVLVSKKSLAKTILPLCVLTLVCLGALFVRIHGSVNGASTARSNSGHLKLWYRGFKVFEEHPTTGVGVGEMQSLVPVKVDRITQGYINLDPSNQLLEWIDETGLIGLIVLIVFQFGIWRTVRSSASPDSLYVGAIWAGILVASMFFTPFGLARRPECNAFLGLLIGMTLTLKPMKQQGSERQCKDA